MLAILKFNHKVTQINVLLQVGTVLIDEREEKLSPELQAVIETEVKRLINVSKSVRV